MKNFLTYLNELLDRPFPYRAEKGGFGKEGQNTFLFSPGEGDEVRVYLEYRVNILHVDFTRNGNLNLTGEGSAERILATVLELVQKFVEKEVPHEIRILAPIEGSGARQRVYEKIISRNASRFGFELVSSRMKDRENWEFSLSHKDNVF
jgi:hypothetical protein